MEFSFYTRYHLQGVPAQQRNVKQKTIGLFPLWGQGVPIELLFHMKTERKITGCL